MPRSGRRGDLQVKSSDLHPGTTYDCRWPANLNGAIDYQVLMGKIIFVYVGTCSSELLRAETIHAVSRPALSRQQEISY